MKKLLLLLIIVVLPLKAVFAQSTYRVQYETQAGVFSVEVVNPEERIIAINGSPYLNEVETFTSGSFIADDTILVKDVLLRFNAYSQQFEIKDNNEIKALQANERIKSVNLNNRYFINHLYFNGKFFEKGFMEVIYEGEISIYKKNVCQIKEGYYNATVSAGHKNDSFSHEEEYYIKTESDQNPKKFFLGKSAFLKELGDKKESVKSYMKKNKLSPKKDDELMEILKYYESI